MMGVRESTAFNNAVTLGNVLLIAFIIGAGAREVPPALGAHSNMWLLCDHELSNFVCGIPPFASVSSIDPSLLGCRASRDDSH